MPGSIDKNKVTKTRLDQRFKLEIQDEDNEDEGVWSPDIETSFQEFF